MGKLIIFLIAIAVLYNLMKGDKKRKAELKKDAPLQGEDMVQDPHCKTYVSKEEAYRIRAGENVYYFCSTECREKYLAKLKNS